MTEDLKRKEVNLEDLQASHRKTLNKVFGNSGVCSTAASTATKGVTVGNTFRLVTNAIVVVTFQNAINAANAKLAVTYTDGNGDQQTTTAKPIYYRGEALPKKLVQAGEVLILRYNGTQWDIIGSLVSDSGSDVAYVPTLDAPPTPQTTTYELDGETFQFAIGQFARLANGSSYDFYQLYDLKNDGTEAVWAGVAALIPSVYSAPTAKILTYNTQPQVLLNAGSTQDGIIYYSLDGETWNLEIPSETNAGEHTVYWKLVGDSTHTSVPKTAISVTIAKADITATAPTAKVLTYNTSDQELINEGSCSAGTMQYSLDDENWSTSVPQATDAGDYTVYWKVVADDNYNTPPSGSVSVNIAKATPTYTAPSAKTPTYNGSAQTLLNAGSTNHGTIKYSADNESWGDSIPSQTNAGNYVVYWKLIGDANHTDVNSTSISVTIAKAAPSCTAPTAKSLTYNGSAQALVNAGSTSDGTIQYSRDNSSWSTSVPTATSAGSKTVYWKIVGDSNHTDKSSTSISVTIAKANPSITSYPYNANRTYNGSAQYLLTGGSANVSGSFSFNTGTNAGSYTGTWTFTPSDTTNYNSLSGNVAATIAKANQSAPTATGSTVNEGSTATATASGGGGQGSIEWSNGNTRTAVGSQTTKARWTGNSNYNASAWSNEVTLKVNVVYNGHAYVDFGLPSGTKWATMNVGATSESGYGNYYMYGKGSTIYNKDHGIYNGHENPLSLNNDTARQVWGGQWRTPTSAQFQELLDYCTWTWTGSGYDVTRNGKKIFLPAAGAKYNSNEATGVGTHIQLWSSTPVSGYDYAYYLLGVSDGEQVYKGVYNGEYKYGNTIRAVVG